MQDLFWTLMTDQEYQKLEKLVEDLVGIKLNLSRKDFIENQLIKRFQTLAISDFDSYYELLKNDTQEMTYLINMATNISTHFFREKHHFEHMVHHILPALIASKQKIRIWSAGCSTGEEAYSLAMILYESIPDLERYDIKILATDVNTDALDFARAGIYEYSHIEKLSKHKRWVHVIQDGNVKKIKIDNALKKLISFRELNLLDPWPMKNPFDVIFCRNVTIYLKPEVTSQLFEKFDKLLKIGGFFILGHSERLNKFQDRYVCLGKTIYKKVV